jgi:hypothetical protein
MTTWGAAACTACQRCRIEYIDHHRFGAERAQGSDLIRRARGTHHVMACRTQERRQATSNRTARSGQKYSHSVFPRSFKEWRRRSFLIWINDWPERCLPTVDLGNRCSMMLDRGTALNSNS